MWQRAPQSSTVPIDLSETTEEAREVDLPHSNGLTIAFLARGVGAAARENGLPANARTLSVFVVNHRPPATDSKRDEAFAFQVRLSLTGCEFLPRPNLRGLETDDWDESVADLQYRDTCEYAVGHNVATEAIAGGVRTCWIPSAQVERVAPGKIAEVELSMSALSKLASGADAETKLLPLVRHYRDWIAAQPIQGSRSAGPRRLDN